MRVIRADNGYVGTRWRVSSGSGAWKRVRVDLFLGSKEEMRSLGAVSGINQLGELEQPPL